MGISKKQRILILFSLLILLFFLSCGTTRKLSYTEDELAKLLKKRLSPEEYEATPIPFAIPDELKTYARLLTHNLLYDEIKADVLVKAIIQQDKLSVRYNKYRSLTAIEVLVTGEANCIAYTNLFIGMARAAGLKAYYVDVTEISNLEREGKLVINSGHICAGVDTDGELLLIDFSEYSRKEYRTYRVIDDLEAMANFENSLGVIISRKPGYYEQTPIPDDEIRYFEKAIKIKPDFAKAYNNLGIAYQRRRNYEKAIEMYKKAIFFNPNLPAPHANLGNVYAALERYQEAEKELKRAIELRKTDPYFYYNLGLVYYNQRNYEKAQKAFEKSISYSSNFAEAHNILGVVYYQLGNLKLAKREFSLALKLNPKLAQAKIYLRKIKEKESVIP